jgi:hypothetical protein
VKPPLKAPSISHDKETQEVSRRAFYLTKRRLSNSGVSKICACEVDLSSVRFEFNIEGENDED